jgi:hypothetical protein
MTIIAVAQVMNCLVGLVKFSKDYADDDEEEEMSESAKRMFS